MRTIDLSIQLDKLEADHPPIPLDSVDYSIKNPDMTREQLETAFRYFARVEREVEANVPQFETLLPYADDNTRRFFEIWKSQELPHGFIFEEIQRQLGLVPDIPNLDYISPGIRLGGTLAHVPAFHDVMELVYFIMGAMNEKMTAIGYGKLKTRLHSLGETALIQTAVLPIMPQETGHYNYYRDSAIDRNEKLSPWKRRMAKHVIKFVYTPVGANNPIQKADFGDAIAQLGPENDIYGLIDKIEKVFDKLTIDSRHGLDLPTTFVREAFDECKDLALTRSNTTLIA